MMAAWISILFLSVVYQAILLGLIGILLEAFRFHFSVGWFLSGVLAIAAVRVFDEHRRYQSEGRPMRGRDRSRIVAKSVAVSFALLTSSLLPCLCVLLILSDDLVPHGCIGSRLDPVITIGIIAILGWPSSLMMRRLLRWNRFWVEPVPTLDRTIILAHPFGSVRRPG